MTSVLTRRMYIIVGNGPGRDGEDKVLFKRNPTPPYAIDTNPGGDYTPTGPNYAYEIDYIRAWALPSGTVTGGASVNPLS